jgi:hypothetical protein
MGSLRPRDRSGRRPRRRTTSRGTTPDARRDVFPAGPRSVNSFAADNRCERLGSLSWGPETPGRVRKPNDRICRYADDFLVLVAGTREDAIRIRDWVAQVQGCCKV